MKNLYTTAIITSCLMGIAVLMHELIHCIGINDKINKNQIFLPSISKSFQLAAESENFLNSQLKAANKRISSIPFEIIKHLLVLGVSFLIFNQNLRRKTQSLISLMVEIYPQYGSKSYLKEISFVSFILTLLLVIVFSGKPLFYKPSKLESEYLFSLIIYSVIAFIIIPLLYIILRKLFKVYSSRLIAACYIAYYVKSLSEFLTVEDVNYKTMKKLDISSFSPNVIDYLKERRLQNHVYGERKKEDTLNAALVGWGSLERIEIYGKHKNLSSRQFEAVLMHEIGHSQDYSLFKKISVLFIIKFVEMFIVFQLYQYVSEEMSDEFLSKQGIFVIVLFFYFLFMDRWLMLFHKLTSQKAENAADFIAKTRGYGDDLAKVLFDITVKAETNIQSTWFYNALKSYHPSVYERIENLKTE